MNKLFSLILALAVTAALLPASDAAGAASSWAAEQVNAAIAAELVPESLQSAYGQPITRAEFCALAVQAYESIKGEIKGRRTFADTNDINVEKAAAIGAVSGIGGNRFDPHGNLTREQAAVMLAQLADATGKSLPKQAATFADNDSIAPWAIERVGQIQAAGVMSGVGDNTFVPRQPYTREQSIVTILRLFDVIRPDIVIDLSYREITNEQLAEMVASGEIPSNVTHLNLAVNSISDLSLLSNFADLTVLDLWGNNVSNLSPLRNLTNLTELILWGNEFEDITPLGNMTNLVKFSLGDHPQFDGDLSVLRNFINLTDLGLGGSQIHEFSPIGSLVNLERLHLWGVSQLNDLSILANLTKLTELTIHAANIQSFAPLRNFTNLTRLNLQGNMISDISALPLESLPNLTSLCLSINQINDISPLSGSIFLTRLTLLHNQIIDVSPLSGLTALTYLSLDRNQIADISPLRFLKNLHQLDIRGLPVTEVQIAELQASLPRCNIYHEGADTYD
jgi:Leucine-rich repeat (LRR) protein